MSNYIWGIFIPRMAILQRCNLLMQFLCDQNGYLNH